MENNTINVLDDFYKAVKMGIDSYAVISEKVDDQKLKDELTIHYNKYQDISSFINKKYEEYGKIPTDTPITQKVMGWTGIQMNTLKDKTSSHIAEMLIQGSIMGIIECTKILNHNEQIVADIKNEIEKFIKLEETCIINLKSYL